MPWRRYENDAFFARGGYWYHKLHIYLYPFYYINYTLTTMGAMEFKKKVRRGSGRGLAGLSQPLQDRRQPQLSRDAALREPVQPFTPGSVARACGYAAEILLKQIAAQEQNA